MPHLRRSELARQLLRALVGTAPPGISLSVDADHGDAAVRLRAEFRDESFLPLDNIGVSAVVSHEDGSAYTIDMLPEADEIFLCNALHGIYPVNAVDHWHFEPGPVTREVQEWLAEQ